MRRKSLPVCKDGERGVLRAAYLHQVRGNLIIETAGPVQKFIVVLGCSLQQVGRCPSISPPIGRKIAMKVLNSEDVIVSKKQIARNRCAAYRAQRQSGSQNNLVSR